MARGSIKAPAHKGSDRNRHKPRHQQRSVAQNAFP